LPLPTELKKQPIESRTEKRRHRGEAPEIQPLSYILSEIHARFNKNLSSVSECDSGVPGFSPGHSLLPRLLQTVWKQLENGKDTCANAKRAARPFKAVPPVFVLPGPETPARLAQLVLEQIPQ
jgi:hypothetical protein